MGSANVLRLQGDFPVVRNDNLAGRPPSLPSSLLLTLIRVREYPFS